MSEQPDALEYHREWEVVERGGIVAGFLILILGQWVLLEGVGAADGLKPIYTLTTVLLLFMYAKPYVYVSIDRVSRWWSQ